MEEMSHRERVVTSLGHQEPDRVPVDFGSMGSTGITALAYAKLRSYLGIRGGRIRVYDTGQQLAEPEKPVLDLFGVDVIDLRRSLPPAAPDGQRWRRWILRDGTVCEAPQGFNPQPDGEGGYVIRDRSGNVVSRMPKDGFYFDSVWHPLEKMKSPSDADQIDWDGMKISDERLRILEEKAAFLERNTDYAIHFHGCGGIHEWGQGLRGWTNWLVDLGARKHLAEALLDRMMDVNMYNLKRIVERIAPHIQVLGFGDDLGMQIGPQISPKVYREMLKPRHEEMFTYAKRHSRCFVFLHSCGSIYRLIPDLIDAGVDALNPVQISAAEMDPKRLKEEFGEQITFWGGGADTQNVLGFRPVWEVVSHVRENLAIFAPGGGFVFNQVHNIQPNVSPEALVAMYQTALRAGSYPIAR